MSVMINNGNWTELSTIQGVIQAQLPLNCMTWSPITIKDFVIDYNKNTNNKNSDLM